ncbi:MAG: DedA family protein [Alphaproteobacteria bacterium]|nr:DedA family protein [Alphaproteobacteria bacterium]
MEELISRATEIVSEYGFWAGPIVGVLAFGESLALVGLFIPATALMIAVGGLMGSGTVAPLPVIVCAAAGAILGDWISYKIGRRIGPSIYRRWPLNRHRPMVARARLFFRRYGFLSIFLGRFLGPIRATIPLVAGVMEMDHRRFHLANVTSALLWAPVIFAPGYFAVRTMGSVGRITEAHLLGIGVIVAFLTVVATLIGARLLGRVDRKRDGRHLSMASAD